MFLTALLLLLVCYLFIMAEELKRELGCMQEQLEALKTPAVGEVKVKLSPFWFDKPKIWFAQAEAQFEIARITQDSTKYGYVLSMLDSRVADEVEDIIVNPPAEGRYEFLKSELIARLSSSKEQKVRQLLSEQQLGDRKPSAFLRHLRSLAGTDVGNKSGILRELWMRRLPQEVQRILMAQKDLDLDKVAEIADAIVDTPMSSHSALSVHAASAVPAVPDLVSMAKCIEELTKKVDALANSRSRSSSRSRSRSRSSSKSRSTSQLCWYHARFGTKARKCVTPCTWNQGNALSNQ